MRRHDYRKLSDNSADVLVIFVNQFCPHASLCHDASTHANSDAHWGSLMAQLRFTGVCSSDICQVDRVYSHVVEDPIDRGT